MRKVIGIGETILDIIFSDNQPEKAVPGGSVFNTFVSLGRLGVPVRFVSELGNDKVGDLIRRFMEENNMSAEFIDCFSGGKSPVSLAFLDEYRHAEYLFYHDSPVRKPNSSFPPIEKNDIFVFGSYYALNPALRERVTELLEYAKEREAIIYYDPNFRKPHAHEAIRLMPSVIENLEYADIVRGSEHDFLNLFGKTDPEYIYREHIRFYCNRFIVTRGSRNIELFTEKLRESFEVQPFTPVSSIGAGDNFNAGIIFGLLKYGITKESLPTLDKETWEKIIRCGIALAREVCLSYDNSISKAFAASCSAQF